MFDILPACLSGKLLICLTDHSVTTVGNKKPMETGSL